MTDPSPSPLPREREIWIGRLAPFNHPAGLAMTDLSVICEGAKPPKQSPAQTRRFGPYPAFANNSPGLLTSPAGMLACIVVMHNMYDIGGTAVNLVTLRNLPPELVNAIRRRVKEHGSSLNKAVISMLQGSLGKGRRKPIRAVHHDLDALVGSWSKEEAARFEAALRDQRAI